MPALPRTTPSGTRVVPLEHRLRELTRVLGWPAALAAGYVVVHALWLVFRWGPPSAHRYIADAFLVPPFLAPTIGAWLVARRPETAPGARRAWRLLAASYLLLFLANVVWFIGDFAYRAEMLQLGRWLVVASYPPLLTGLFMFPAAPRRGTTRLRLALDVGTVVLASGLVMWYVLIRPHAAAAHGLPGLGVLPPVADVGVVLAIATMLLRRPDPASRASLRLLAAGHLVSIAAGVALGVRVLLGIRSPVHWTDAVWMLSDLLLFLATRFPSGGRDPSPEDERDIERIAVLPYVFVAVGVALLLVVTRDHEASGEGVVLAGNALILGLVLARQILAMRDIRRLVAERQAQEARFRALVQHASDVVTVVEGDGTIDYLAPSAERIFGVRVTEWTGRPFVALAHLQDVDALRDLLARAWTAGGEPVRGSWRAVADGREVALETIAALTVEGPDAGKLVLTSRDVSDRLLLEERLRHGQKLEAVGRLAGGVAHDFNNLLAAIRCHAALIREDTPADDPRAEEAREIELAIDRATALTRQLLAFSRKQVLRPARLDLNALVRTTERLVRRLCGERVVVRVSLVDEPWSVLADAGQLEQVVMNLAVNARDAMPDGGTLTLRTANVTVGPALAATEPGLRPGDYATLSVHDTGTGMADEVVAHLFEPFFTTKEKGKGTGLGLSTVFGIITHAGGHVTVESVPGAGSVFTIHLPRCTVPAQEAASGQAAAPAPLRGSGAPTRTILVVDDESSLRTAVERILRRAGYVVLTAVDGVDALRVAREHQRERGATVDVLLTDVAMPNMDGEQLALEFARRYPATRVIRMTGYAQEAGTRARLSNVDTAFLAKPFTVDAVTAAVREAMTAPAGGPGERRSERERG